MAIKFYTLGGIDESGRNMTAYELPDGRIIICDMGLHLTNLVLYNDEFSSMTREEMVEKDIVANPSLLKGKEDKVVAIVISHAHLDHVGAAHYLASLFNCPIFGTPYTIEVLKVLMKSQRNKNCGDLKNKFIKMNPNSFFDLGHGLKLEFVNVTHSTPQAAMIAIHTPDDGIILYAMDFRFDNRPALGFRSNYNRLKEIGDEGVNLLVMDSVRSNSKRKSASEIVVKEMLRDIFIETNLSSAKGIIITTFASHIARLKSIVELSTELKRKVVFLGRSIKKYTFAASNARLINFEKQGVIICETPKEVNKWLDIINKDKEKYLIVCTGHQGEPNAVLSKIVEKRTPYEITKDDVVIFSSEVIPTQITIDQSKVLQSKLDGTNCKIFRDIHVSGHAAQEDQKLLLEMVKPKHIVPGHGHIELKEGAIEVCEESGYKQGKTLHILEDGKMIEFEDYK